MPKKATGCCTVPEVCCPRLRLEERPLLSFVQAVEVMALFKVLANDTRLRILHELIRAGEAKVTSVAATLGMKPQAVSNQLQRLADTGIVASRRDGNSIYYRVIDGCVPVLLDQAICIMDELRFKEHTTNK